MQATTGRSSSSSSQPRFTPSISLLFLATATLLTAAAGESRLSLIHHHLQREQHRPTAHRSTWRVAQRVCQKAGAKLPTLLQSKTPTDVKTLVSALTEQAADWPAAGCHWLGDSFDEDFPASLRRLIDNGGRRGLRIAGSSSRRCLCVRIARRSGRSLRSSSVRRHPDFGYDADDDDSDHDDATDGGSRRPRLRLHLTSCWNRLPYHCQRRAIAAVAATTTESTGKKLATTTAKTAIATQKPHSKGDDGEVPEEASDLVPPNEGDPDETLDHGKFPAFEVRPDGHPKGWLPPWHVVGGVESTAEPPSPTTQQQTADAENAKNETSPSQSGGALGRLLHDQRSEFVTLLVLYSIVAVICMVLLGLCLVRCCRGYCGRSKVRYVRQVDADDIPRFMPSSWA